MVRRPESVPFMNYQQIRERVDEALSDLHPDGTIPIPIEQMVELRLGIEIVPMPGLQRAFDVCAFVSQDLSQIMIDEDAYKYSKRHTRFSYAHELGHVMLHRRFYMSLSFDSVEEWRAVMNSVHDATKWRLENQANDFAGLILVPGPALVAQLDVAREKVKQAGLDPQNLSPEARTFIEEYLGKKFDVSAAVIHRRLEYEGFWLKNTGTINAN